MGYATDFANHLGIDDSVVIKEMTSGDYENLVDVFEHYFGDFVTLYR
jgi:hypothetical protein